VTSSAVYCWCPPRILPSLQTTARLGSTPIGAKLFSRNDAIIMKKKKNSLRVYKGPLTKRITVLVPKQSKDSWKTLLQAFRPLSPEMTVAEYYLACEQIGEKPRRYKLDIEWDLDRQFIRLD